MILEILKPYISKEAPLADWLGVFGTILIGLLALFGDTIRKTILRPKLEFVTTKISVQRVTGGVITMFRLNNKKCRVFPCY